MPHIEMNEKDLQTMLFWRDVYYAELRRVINVLQYWKENPL
jgi:hypothetical protein